MGLNLFAPGLGLLRVGHVKNALILIAVPVLALLGSAILFRVTPTATFHGAVAYIVVLAIITIVTMIVAMRLSWHHSAVRSGSPSWWSRWYGLLLMAGIAGVTGNLAAVQCHRFYKPFYIPAESMAPTLALNDKIMADMRFRGPARIGDILLINTPSGTYVKRVAAVAGDRIAMRDGVPIVNGRSAAQRRINATTFQSSGGPEAADLFEERLPGERHAHRILDIGSFWVDDTSERIVPEGHMFVLGDNRDRSADSRVPLDQLGNDMVDLNDIVGRPLFIHWSRDRSRIGTPVTR